MHSQVARVPRRVKGSSCMAKQKDYFISYNKADRLWAGGIRDWLMDSGKTVIMQQADFHAGSNFPLEMDAALKGSKRMIGVLSPDYLTSEFCQSEWAAKFREDPTGRNRLLVFVKVRACALEGLLASIVHIDLTDLPVDEAEKKLLDSLSQIVAGAAPKKRGKILLPVPEPRSSPPSTTLPSAKTVIHQQSTGGGATNIGIQNNIKTERYTVRNEIKPGDEHISPAQRSEINDRLKELGDREALVALKKKFPIDPQTPEEVLESKEITRKIFQYLRADFNRALNDGQSYQLLPKDKFDEALKWLRSRKGMKRASLRRTDNEAWRRDYETIIWASMRDKKWQKQRVYDYALEKGFTNSPITSLKELGEQSLKKLGEAMRRMPRSQKRP